MIKIEGNELKTLMEFCNPPMKDENCRRDIYLRVCNAGTCIIAVGLSGYRLHKILIPITETDFEDSKELLIPYFKVPKEYLNEEITIEFNENNYVIFSYENGSTKLELKNTDIRDFNRVDDLFKHDSTFEIAIKAKYLMQMAKAIQDKDKDAIVKLEFTDAVSPIFCKDTGEDNREVLLLPVRLNHNL